MEIFHDLLERNLGDVEELRNRVKLVDDLLTTLHHCTVDNPKATWENKLLSSYYAEIDQSGLK